MPDRSDCHLFYYTAKVMPGHAESMTISVMSFEFLSQYPVVGVLITNAPCTVHFQLHYENLRSPELKSAAES